jgi:hypothetical protein
MGSRALADPAIFFVREPRDVLEVMANQEGA